MRIPRRLQADVAFVFRTCRGAFTPGEQIPDFLFVGIRRGFEPRGLVGFVGLFELSEGPLLDRCLRLSPLLERLRTFKFNPELFADGRMTAICGAELAAAIFRGVQ